VKPTNVLEEKSYAFALRIVNAYKYLTDTYNEYVLSKQLLRSGTSISALIKETQYAQSKTDFVHKLSVALKEASKTQYWLSLLHDADYIDTASFQSIESDNVELLKLLIASINTAKHNIQHKSVA